MQRDLGGFKLNLSERPSYSSVWEFRFFIRRPAHVIVARLRLIDFLAPNGRVHGGNKIFFIKPSGVNGIVRKLISNSIPSNTIGVLIIWAAPSDRHLVIRIDRYQAVRSYQYFVMDKSRRIAPCNAS